MKKLENNYDEKISLKLNYLMNVYASLLQYKIIFNNFNNFNNFII